MNGPVCIPAACAVTKKHHICFYPETFGKVLRMIISDELRSHIKQDRLQFYAHSCMEMWTAFHASGENEILSLLPQLISPSEMAVWSAKLLNPDGTLKPGPLYGEYPGLEEILQRVSSDCDIYLDEMEARIEKNRADISRVFFSLRRLRAGHRPLL
jgi:hypothetical protein